MKKWTNSEYLGVCKLYFTMLILQQDSKLGRGKNKTTKAALIRKFQTGSLADRSRQSIEMAMMNLSAIRQAQQLEIVSGYKALKNFSSALKLVHDNCVAFTYNDKTLKVTDDAPYGMLRVINSVGETYYCNRNGTWLPNGKKVDSLNYGEVLKFKKH